MARDWQFMLRLPEPARERLEAIAIHHVFTGGRGRIGHDEPNKADAARWLLGQADPKLFEILFGDEPAVRGELHVTEGPGMRVNRDEQGNIVSALAWPTEEPVGEPRPVGEGWTEMGYTSEDGVRRC
jgi:hypothetical protein